MSEAFRDAASRPGEWPVLRVDDWTETRDTLRVWLQVVGKVRLAKAPMVNHWWQVPLYLTPRGLTTSVIPDRPRAFEIEFDFCTDELHVDLEGGDRRTVTLESKPVADFYAETFGRVGELGIDVASGPSPWRWRARCRSSAITSTPAYDPGHAQLFWRQLLAAERVFSGFRGRFIGKVSPVHFFWGGMDLAVTRFSGRPAPRHPGGAPRWATG